MSQIKQAGDAVPSMTFRTRVDDDWVDVTTEQIFNDRTVIVFALPGAFTPTCSSTHLPGYLILSDQLRQEGVDEIYCLSVNDSFVMNAWGKDQHIQDKVRMLPDGSGHFSRGMGLLVDKDNLGFGDRSWRYSMLVVNGIIEKIFLEDFADKGDPFKVSDAETMLVYLKSRIKKEVA